MFDPRHPSLLHPHRLLKVLCWFTGLCWLMASPTDAWAISPPAKKEQCTLCEHSAPQLWIVNTRCAPRCSDLDNGFDRLTYQRWDPDTRCFIDETLESFLACQSNIPTLLFSHGNSLTHEKALEACWKVYERIKVCPGPKMLVFWSWPAEIVHKRPLVFPIRLARKNISTKYVYSEYQGYYIAKLTQLMSTAQPLTLSGHSYGGVTVICALHYLGGGCLNGLVFDGGVAEERHNLRAAIISGALDNDAMYPGYRYGQSFAPVETFFTTYNDRDSTLKRWPTHSFRGQQAAGYTGICAGRLGQYAHKLCQQKLTQDVGRSHYMRPHLASTQMISAICRTAFETDVSSCPGSSKRRGLLEGRSLDVEDVLQVPIQTVFPGLAL